MSQLENARIAMVDSQVRVNDVTDVRIQNAMRELPRERFAPKSKRAAVYGDLDLELDDGRWLMRPRDFSKLVQELDIKADDLVLDIACGLGYSTAVLSRLAETVVGLEDDPRRVTTASERLAEVGADNAVVLEGDLKAGVADQGPYDVIFVNGGVEAPPQAWLDQLAEGGRLGVVVRAGAAGEARIYHRAGASVGARAVFDAMTPVLPGFELARGFTF